MKNIKNIQEKFRKILEKMQNWYEKYWKRCDISTKNVWMEIKTYLKIWKKDLKIQRKNIQYKLKDKKIMDEQ